MWYTEYLSKFPYVPFITPDELWDDFDWALLEKLVTWSFSSDYELKLDKDTQKNELYIAVKSWDQSVVKTVSELWSFQMSRLYEIYVEEQMNLQILRKENAEDEQSVQAIDSEREMRLKKWEAVLDTMWREQLAKETKVEGFRKGGFDRVGRSCGMCIVCFVRG